MTGERDDARPLFARLLTDRFMWFILIGAGLFALNAILSDRSGTVVVTQDDIEMLEGRYAAQTGVEPRPEQRQGLIDHHVREEILVREAQRVGLDRDDVIVRRRLAQKMELSIRDGFEPKPISEQSLRDWYAEHPEHYSTRRRIAFRHVFLGDAGETPPDAANTLLENLNTDSGPDTWRSAGKPFMLAREFGPRDRAELSELFGPAFAEDLLGRPAIDTWIGPIESSYGQHLVELIAIEPEEALSFDLVREQVRADIIAEQQRAYEDEAWRAMFNRYRVKVDEP